MGDRSHIYIDHQESQTRANTAIERYKKQNSQVGNFYRAM